MRSRTAALLAVALLAACGTSKPSQAGQVALAARLAHQACIGTLDVAGEGSATCDTSTAIAVWGSASERDVNLTKTRALGPAAFVEGPTWYISCDPANAGRIAVATGGKIV